MKMKTKLFRKIVETHGRASLLLLATAYCLVRAGLKPAPYCLLLLATAPAFAQADLTVCAGKGYTLQSASGKGAAGASPLTFTWYVSYNNNNDTEISDSNAESITIPGKSDPGTYAYTRKVASVDCPGGVFTKPYTVLVHPLPKVAQTGASTWCGSGSHTLTVDASVDSDGEVSVAWYTDAGLAGGTVSNTTSCTVSASTVVGTYTYYVQATANTTQCKAAATVTATRAQTEGLIGGWRLPGAIGETATFTDPRDGKQYETVKMPDGKVWFAQNLNYTAGLTWNEYSNQAHGSAFTATTNGVPAIGSYWCPGAHSLTSSSSATCDVYGALYTWETAMMINGKYSNESNVGNDNADSWDEDWVKNNYWSTGAGKEAGSATVNNAQGGGRGICPPDWHVPTDAEWAVLLDASEASASTAHSAATSYNWYGTNAGTRLKSAGTCTGNYCATDDNPAWTNHDNRGTDVYGFRVLPSGYRYNYGSSFHNRGVHAHFWSSSVYSGQYA